MKNVIELQKQFIAADNEALLQTDIVSAYTGLSISWFNNRAYQGGGIPFTKLLTKRLYKKADVLAWLEENSSSQKTTLPKKRYKREEEKLTDKDIGKLCLFWNDKDHTPRIDILRKIVGDAVYKYHLKFNGGVYKYGRRITKEEAEAII